MKLKLLLLLEDDDYRFEEAKWARLATRKHFDPGTATFYLL